MKFKIVYTTVAIINLQPGKIISLRSEMPVGVAAPCACFNPLNPGIADGCAITDWLELSPEDISAIFERGEKTIDATTGQLCDVIDVARNNNYKELMAARAAIELAEQEATNGV